MKFLAKKQKTRFAHGIGFKSKIRRFPTHSHPFPSTGGLGVSTQTRNDPREPLRPTAFGCLPIRPAGSELPAQSTLLLPPRAIVCCFDRWSGNTLPLWLHRFSAIPQAGSITNQNRGPPETPVLSTTGKPNLARRSTAGGLFVPQRQHWIEAHRSPRRNPTGRRRNSR
jgi:hypothetical protein